MSRILMTLENRQTSWFEQHANKYLRPWKSMTIRYLSTVGTVDKRGHGITPVSYSHCVGNAIVDGRN